MNRMNMAAIVVSLSPVHFTTSRTRFTVDEHALLSLLWILKENGVF